MDEWVTSTARKCRCTHPLSFERADRELCFDRIDPNCGMPETNLHFPKADVAAYVASWDRGPLRGDAGRAGRRQALGLQRSRSSAKGTTRTRRRRPRNTASWARAWSTCIPITLIQNARTSGGGIVTMVPTQAITVGPVETWKAEKVSIWQAGTHDNPFGSG